MVSLKVDRFLHFTASSGNKFQYLMVAGNCLKMYVVQIGSLSRVFLVLQCRFDSASIAIRTFIIL